MLSISKLDKSHDRQAFDCGVEPLNRFIKQLASQLIKRDEVVIYVAHDGSRIAGYFTLSNAHIVQDDDPNHLKRQSPHTPIGCVLIGRLAVDVNYRSIGLGGDLLLNALIKVKQISQMTGTAFVVVDAKDDTAKAFYQHYGFMELENKPMRLIYPVSSIPNQWTVNKN